MGLVFLSLLPRFSFCEAPVDHGFLDTWRYISHWFLYLSPFSQICGPLFLGIYLLLCGLCMQSCHIIQLLECTIPPHPQLQENYTGAKQLSGNNRSWVISIAKFGPTAFDFGYEFWLYFWVKIRALVQKHLQSLTGFDFPIISGVKFWWFSFFYFLSRSSRTRVSPVWRLRRNWWHL